MTARTRPRRAPRTASRSLARGLRLRRNLVGADYAARADAGFDPALADARAILLDHVWGKVWTRKQVDLRTRSFMTIALLTALNRPQELRAHLNAAEVNGLTRVEIGEAILHAAAYCGVPAGVGAMAVARELFQQQDAAKRGARSRTTRRR